MASASSGTFGADLSFAYAGDRSALTADEPGGITVSQQLIQGESGPRRGGIAVLPLKYSTRFPLRTPVWIFIPDLLRRKLTTAFRSGGHAACCSGTDILDSWQQ